MAEQAAADMAEGQSMLRTRMMQLVQQAIFEETGELVTPDARIRLLVTDSLEMASLVQALEDATGKEIPDDDAQRLFTVQDIVNYAEAN